MTLQSAPRKVEFGAGAESKPEYAIFFGAGVSFFDKNQSSSGSGVQF